MSKRRAAFLDRDGTIIEDAHYLASPDGVLLMPGAAEAIRRLNENHILAIVVTNQSGIARGLLTPHDLEAIHARLQTELAAAGAHLDAILHCPHHPEGSVPAFTITCDCRKPATGMVVRACGELSVDLPDSAVIGNAASDMQLALNLGIPGLLVGPATAEAGALCTAAVPGLREAVDWMIANPSPRTEPVPR